MLHITITRTYASSLLVLFSFIFAMSGCSSSSSDNPAPQADPGSSAPPVLTRSTNLGEVYTDQAGMTLYTFNSDVPGVSNCDGGCADAWPPLLASDAAAAADAFSIITRTDGSRQWALNGWPLYLWRNDSAPGDTTGEEVNALWYVARPQPVSAWNASVTTGGVSNTVTVLTDVDRKTLYSFTNDKDKPGGSACNDGCADAWPPLIAAADAQANGDFTLVTRDDDTQQWAYRGIPLYRWASDVNPGDTTGEEVNDIWYVIQPIPVNKFTTSTQGVVISDTAWLSLYVLDNETTASLVCTAACLDAWPPLAAAEGEIDRGDYTIFSNDNDERQWAYKDRPLYHWNGDTTPGDTFGHGLAHGGGGTWIVAKP